MSVHFRTSGQPYAVAEAPLDRNGIPLTPSTPIDPHLFDFLNSAPSIHPKTEAPLDRNGIQLTPSTLIDPHLFDFLNSVPSIQPKTLTPELLATFAEQISHDEACSFCIYYEYQDRFSSTRPIRNSYSQCNLRTNSQNVCGSCK